MRAKATALAVFLVCGVTLANAANDPPFFQQPAHVQALATTTTSSLATSASRSTVIAANTVTVPTSSTTSTTLLVVPVCGNPNFDEIVSASDALYVLRTAVHSEVCELCVCDVDDSGAITASDALAVLRHAVGTLEALGCAPCEPVAVCGDGVVNQTGEECDGDDDDSCPGSCNPDCTCAVEPECGDGVVNQTGEDCDGQDADACPGLCRENCTCPLAVCGNDVVERTEVCEATDLKGQSCTTLGFAGGTLACAANCKGFDSSACDLPSALPPDPEDVASEIDPTVATDVGSSTEFLYTGANRLQYGVGAGAIQRRRAAVLRGSVRQRDGSPLAAVEIRVLGHPEFGATQTRSDGRFDMAVNGGGLLTIDYRKSGFLPAQRQLEVPWRDYVKAPEVVLIALDTQVTTIDLTAGDPMQVARGTEVSDEDGTRQSTLLFAQGTQAEMVLADGSRQALNTLDVRATEYTVGDAGPQAMPAELPANSGYTYAFELSVDEAMAAGATDVEFSEPVAYYVENFLDAEVGSSVPVGYYDRGRGTWVPSQSGRVVKVVSVAGGMAELDTDGDDVADDAATLEAVGVTDAERERLASLYTAGQTLWRVAVTHFSSWDCNWGFGPPDDAEFPNQPDPDAGNSSGEECEAGGSIIECLNRVLGESVPVVGTPFTLNYRSNRVPGYDKNTLDISLSGPTVPASMIGIELEVEVAGQKHTNSLSTDHECLQQPATLAPRGATGLVAGANQAPANATVTDLTNQSYRFVWDGKDAYGRTVQSRQAITVRIGYKYCGVYQQTYRFASNSGLPIDGSLTRQELVFWQEWQGHLGTWDARGQGLGGWTLDVYHSYDPWTQSLYLGNGTRRDSESIKPVINRVAGDLEASGHQCEGCPATQMTLYPSGVAVAVDGSLYIAISGNKVHRVTPDGLIWTVAGTGFGGYSGDGGPATDAKIDPYDVAIGPDGSFYFTDYTLRIRRVTPDGTITTIAGDGTSGYSGDGGPATAARFMALDGLAVGTDGSLYVADRKSHTIRRIAPDGAIERFAGNRTPGYDGDNGPANQALLNRPVGVAVGPDGSVYIAEEYNHRIRRVGPDGIITTVAGNGTQGYSGDGGLATSAQIDEPEGVDVGRDGTLYITERSSHRLRAVSPNGIMTTVAGGIAGYSPDGTAASDARLYSPISVAVGADGLFVANSGWIVQKISPALQNGSGGLASTYAVASQDGRELYVFDASGRHLETLDALTGSLKYRFENDANGLLRQIEDGDGNASIIERDASGDPTAIVGPYAERTELGVNTGGYLTSVRNPGGETTAFTYTADGLLTEMTDPQSHSSSFAYDSAGRLTRDDDAAGGYQTLVDTDVTDGYEVARTTALGKTTSYRVEKLSSGEERITSLYADGTQAENLLGAGAGSQHTASDGTLTDAMQGPDPRFGAQAQILSSVDLATPGGVSLSVRRSSSATVTDPHDPFSLEDQTEDLRVNGKLYRQLFDAASREWTLTTPAGREVRTLLDGRGRVISRRMGGLAASVYGYDARGRLAEIRRGAGGATRRLLLNYGADGRVATLENALQQTASYSYDGAGRLVLQRLPGGRQVSYGYNASGNLTSLTPPGGETHTFVYNAVGLGEIYRPPDVEAGTTETLYGYDLDRRLTQVGRPDGRTIDFSYDNAGRLATVGLARGTISYEYDETTGELISATAPDEGVVVRTFDGFLVTRVSWSGDIVGKIDFAYDNDLRVVSIGVNDDTPIGLTYDDDGLLTGAGSLVFTRDDEMGAAVASVLGEVSDTRTFNSFGELQSYHALAGTSELYSLQLRRDQLGRITGKTQAMRGGASDDYVYSYDVAGRLVQVSKNGVTAASYGYDPAGNRTSASDGGGSVGASYDAQDRLLEHGSTTYTYTAAGELLTKTEGGQTTSYEYDELGSLVGVDLPGGARIDYVMDGAGRRIGKKVDGTLVMGFLYEDELRVAAELDGTGAVVARFVYADKDNVPAYMEKGGNSYRIVSDHLGSPRLVVDVNSGEIAQELDYDAFGQVVTDTSPGFQPFGFAGGLYDADTGLVRFGVRDYDAEVGRWTVKDPVGFAGGTNLYAYVGNDPASRKDARGTGGLRCGDDISPVQPESPYREGNGTCGGDGPMCIVPDWMCAQQCAEAARIRSPMRGSDKNVCRRDQHYPQCLADCGLVRPVPDEEFRSWKWKVNRFLENWWARISEPIRSPAKWDIDTTNACTGNRG